MNEQINERTDQFSNKFHPACTMSAEVCDSKKIHQWQQWQIKVNKAFLVQEFILFYFIYTLFIGDKQT